MGKVDMRKIKAIEKENKQRILNVCPNCPETSGIYFFIRKENGFKYAYIGQAKHLLTRISNPLRDFQHIDLSIKKHGLFSESNPCGYTVNYLEFPESMLDEKEQEYILKYANAGYQLRNKTSGSQGEGKKGIESNKSGKGYYDGKEAGYLMARKEIAHWFSLHLNVSMKKPTKNAEKALAKFQKFIDLEAEDGL